ncbi:MAG: hypothetical protein IPN38_19125 [Flavobacteriales bacterium]|nr:hypothetical protein [Flavobacteriales bacterium]
MLGGFQFLGALVHPAVLLAEEDVPRIAHRVGFLASSRSALVNLLLALATRFSSPLLRLLQVGEFAPAAIEHGAQVQHQLLQVLSVLSTSPFRLSNLALMMPETMSSALLLLAAALSISLSMLSNFEITSPRLLLLNARLQLVHLLLVPELVQKIETVCHVVLWLLALECQCERYAMAFDRKDGSPDDDGLGESVS